MAQLSCVVVSSRHGRGRYPCGFYNVCITNEYYFRCLFLQFIRSKAKMSVGTSGDTRPRRIWRRKRRRARCGRTAGAKRRSIWPWTCYPWTTPTRITTQNRNTTRDIGIPIRVSHEKNSRVAAARAAAAVEEAVRVRIRGKTSQATITQIHKYTHTHTHVHPHPHPHTPTPTQVTLGILSSSCVCNTNQCSRRSQ